MILVFLIYGAAFFGLAVAILVFPKRGSLAPVSRDLNWVAAFALLHGTNEWLDMLDLTAWGAASALLDALRLAMLPASFVCLAIFGCRVITRAYPRARHVRLVPIVLVAGWALGTVLSSDPFLMGPVLARYLTGLPGIGVSITGLLITRRELDARGVSGTHGRVDGVAAVLVLYAFAAGLVVPSASFFPASVVNQEVFAAVFGFPIQILRAACAVAIAAGLVGLLAVFDWETKEALRRAKLELDERVRQRTAELEASTRQLRDEMRLREALEREVTRMQRLESLGLLAGGIAHDYNNLLMAILGNVSLVRARLAPSSEAYELLGRSERAVEQAQDLSRQLLTFAKGGEPTKRICSIADVARDACRLCFTGTAVAHEIRVQDGLWPVEADADQMGQVLRNILLNAIEAMPHGGKVTLTCDNLHLGPSEGLGLVSGEYVRVTVSDTGLGIPSANLDKIFDPFFTTKPRGHGLGLSIAHSVVARHGGTIRAESRPGQGATFTVVLPATHQPLPARAVEVAPLPAQGHILVMDDEESVRRVARVMIETLGFSVAVAADGDEAVESYRRARANGRPFDLVILDLTVAGGVGGIEAARRLKEIDPAVRMVVSSGYANDPAIAHSKELGFAGVLTKPYGLEALRKALSQLLSGPAGS